MLNSYYILLLMTTVHESPPYFCDTHSDELCTVLAGLQERSNAAMAEMASFIVNAALVGPEADALAKGSNTVVQHAQEVRGRIAQAVPTDKRCPPCPLAAVCARPL